MGKIGSMLGNLIGGNLEQIWGGRGQGAEIGEEVGSWLPFSHGYNGVIEHKRTKVHTKKASAKKHKKNKK